MTSEKPSPLVVGLSGVSSSGKTTIARLIREILPIRVVILHEDDFFLPEAQLPQRDGLVNWDCAGSLDLKGLVSMIRHLKRTGQVPADFESKEDRNEVGPSGISEETIQRYKREAEDWLASKEGAAAKSRELFLIDGFLLFGKSLAEVREAFDLRLLLRTSYEKGKERRESRPSYATIEGFWVDPPGYWDRIVWPEYVEEHQFMFKDGNVEGSPDDEALKNIGVKLLPGNEDQKIDNVLAWVLAEIKNALISLN